MLAAGSIMEAVQGFIVLLDISGYTRYVRAHNTRYVPFIGKRFKTTGDRGEVPVFEDADINEDDGEEIEEVST